MDDTRCRQFFLEPQVTYHRQYEALRAFFVEGRRLKEIAQQFGYQEASLRVMVCRFRKNVKSSDLPPFFFNRRSGDRRSSRVSERRSRRKSRRSPIAAK
jgi:hypothetical protein